jgi:hypothetical protein
VRFIKITVLLFSILFVSFLSTSIPQTQKKSYASPGTNSFVQIAQATSRAVELVPRNAIFLTAFKWETEKKEDKITIVNKGDKPLEIKEMKAEGNNRFAPRLTTVEDGQRYELSVKLNPDAASGKAQGLITLYTNKGQIKIPVFTFLKNRVYMSDSMVEFGKINLKQLSAKPALRNFLTYSVFIYQYHGEDFKINYESSLPFMSIKKTPPEGPGAVINIPRQGKTSVFELAITPIVERLKPGRFQGTIRVTTNDKDFPQLVIPVRGEVVEN